MPNSQDYQNNIIDFSISGMSCSSCVSRVEKALNKVPGVISATVNLAIERAHVNYTNEVTQDQLKQAIIDAGYGAEVFEIKDRLHRHVASISGWQVVLAAMLSLPLFIPMVLNLVDTHWLMPSWMQWLLADRKSVV